MMYRVLAVASGRLKVGEAFAARKAILGRKTGPV
jgi:hypothetical protein